MISSVIFHIERQLPRTPISHFAIAGLCNPQGPKYPLSWHGQYTEHQYNQWRLRC